MGGRYGLDEFVGINGSCFTSFVCAGFVAIDDTATVSCASCGSREQRFDHLIDASGFIVQERRQG